MPAAPPQLPVWSVPLVPLALAMTAGIILDRFWIVPLGASIGFVCVGVLAWLIFANTPKKRLALVYLWAAVAGFGAAYHHWQRHHLEANDLSRFAEREPQPARLRGTLQTATSAARQPRFTAHHAGPGFNALRHPRHETPRPDDAPPGTTPTAWSRSASWAARRISPSATRSNCLADSLFPAPR